jgi:eukaryotic-like serine/threonine-protein kinase
MSESGKTPSKATPSRSRSSLPVAVGGTLGKYQVSFEIARGGMATVFLASTEGCRGVRRYVALKVLRKELARDQSFVDMFFDEAQIATQLQHPNVCAVLDFDVQDDVHFLALEYLSGQTLTKVLRELHAHSSNYSAEKQAGFVCRLVAEACEGLHAAHELTNARGEPLNVVHRDVAPDNLFVTYDGFVKVLDFGVASATHQSHHTATGLIKGKCSYIAPEVLKGNKPDRTADVWGLGVTAWEMLTHKKLFKGEHDVATFRAICTGQIPKPSDACPTVPAALDEIVMKAIKREPSERYRTAREFGRALHGWMVENKLNIGMAEVAETMAELFPGGREYSRKLFEVAQQLEPGEGAAPPKFTPPTSEVSAIQVVPSIHRLPKTPEDPALWMKRAVAGALATAAASVVLALAALVSAHSTPVAPPAMARPAAPSGVVREKAEEPPTPGPVKVTTAGAIAGAPYGLEVSPLSTEENGELVLRLRVTAR